MTNLAQMKAVSASLRTDQYLFLILVGVLPVMWPFRVKLYGLDVLAADLIFVVSALAWLSALIRGVVKLRRGWFYLPLAIYLAAMICSTIASADPRRSMFKLVGEFYLLCLAVLTFNQVSSLSLLRFTIRVWLWGTALTVAAAVLGVLFFYAGARSPEVNTTMFDYGNWPKGNYPRTRGLFLNGNMLCNYLGVGLMLLLTGRSLGWVRGAWYWPLGAGLAVAALFTLSPGLGGLSLSLGLWLWLRFRRDQSPTPGRIFLVGGCVVAAAAFIAITFKPFSYRDGGFGVPILERQVVPSSRALAWATALETFRQNPVLGKGVGMEVAAARQVKPSGRPELLTDAHNSWLSIAGQEGIIGLLAFAGLTFFLFKRLLPLGPDANPHTLIRAGLCLAFVDAFLYQSLSGSFEDTRHLWVLFGMMAAAGEGLPGSGLEGEHRAA